MPLTLLDYKKKIYKQLGIYDASLANFTDDEDILARINDVIDKAVKFAFYGKSDLKVWKIVHGKSPNMISHQNEVYTHIDADIEFTASKAFSYYFEVDDKCTVEISQGGTVLETINHPTQTGERAFTAFKGEISGAAGEPVKITFKGDSYYSIQNIALYGTKFSSTDRIPDFKVWVPHAIPANLYQLKRVFLPDGSGVDYRVVGKNLLIRYDTIGEISAESAYFPDTITSATLDTAVIDVPTQNEAIIVDKACAFLTQKSQSYRDYTADADQGMQNLDQRPAVATARVVKLYDI